MLRSYLDPLDLHGSPGSFIHAPGRRINAALDLGCVHVTFNGGPIGDTPDRDFAEWMLATFIGAVPPTPRLKRELPARHLISAVTFVREGPPRSSSRHDAGNDGQKATSGPVE
jgi:hypothetical protein